MAGGEKQKGLDRADQAESGHQKRRIACLGVMNCGRRSFDAFFQMQRNFLKRKENRV